MKTRRIPFDINKAKSGARIVTRGGDIVKICKYNAQSDLYPLRGIVLQQEESFTKEGKFSRLCDSCLDLFIEEEEEEKTKREYSGTDSIYVPKDDEGIREELIDAINGLWDNDALPMPLSIKRKDAWLAWLEKQGGEKPADNKPKFQEGDWVVFNPGCNAHQIIRVVENATSHTYGYDTVDDYYFSDISEGVRLWNINDAKDGDVLVNGSNIFIFHFINDTRIMGFCHVNTDDDRFYIDLGKNDGFCLIDDVVAPATKEQCDFLFQRMKEAGYMWNSDKKELHKIDPKFKVGDKVVLKCDKSFVGSIMFSFIGTYCIRFENANRGWYSEQELEPYEMIEKETKTHRMTNQELAWWLRDSPEEHRECSMLNDDGGVFDRHIYYDEDANEPVKDGIIIRKNGGEWEEPLVEI